MKTQVHTLNNTSLLASKAVLFRLFTSSFAGNMRDNPLTTEVSADHKTESKRISVRKNIMQGKELNAVMASLQSLRALSEKLSAPWLDGGLRIMSAKALVDAKMQIEAGKRKFIEKVDDFIAAYDAIIARDRIALNGTFRAQDYPSKESLRARFAARLEFFPIASDFRVEGIDAAVRDELTAEMEKLTAGRVSDAKRELIERIREKVSALSTKLATMTDESRVHPTIVSNVTEACEQVKAANFDGDTTLDSLANKVADTIGKLDSDTFRDDENARETAKETAKAALADIDSVMAEMSGFMA